MADIEKAFNEFHQKYGDAKLTNDYEAQKEARRNLQSACEEAGYTGQDLKDIMDSALEIYQSHSRIAKSGRIIRTDRGR